MRPTAACYFSSSSSSSSVAPSPIRGEELSKTPAMTTARPRPRPRLSHRLMGVLRRNPIKSIGVTALAMAYGYDSYLTRQEEQQEMLEEGGSSNGNGNGNGKKKVLVLPFYKMKLVEEASKTISLMPSASSSSSNSSMEFQVDELVTLIHQAAQDPNICALYGIFGNAGTDFPTSGWAHIEEIRNALLVFQQSHRVHKSPGDVSGGSNDNNHNGDGSNNTNTNTNNNNNANIIGNTINNGRPRKRKPLYAYANTFASPIPGGDMREYYLASVFTHIQLQPQGDLNLFGLHTTNSFWKECLAKYGVQIHVWKHGRYKNFANKFTHSKFSNDHEENVANILRTINQHVCLGIYTSRQKSLKSNLEFSTFWTMVHQAGSFPANIAQQIGFVDYLPRKDPLNDLVKHAKNNNNNNSNSNKQDENDDNDDEASQTNLRHKWGKETNLDQFHATAKISIAGYAKQQAKQKQKQEKQWIMFERLSKLGESNSSSSSYISSGIIKPLLSLVGYSAPHYNIPQSEFSPNKAKGRQEKIAVLKIGGPITEATARKTERALRKLKQQKDVKAIVLRVDSPGGSITACETIYQELQDLPSHQKVVVSFGNVSASGGYYISANAEHIFASPTTVTGSIGVFMLRVDLRGLAKQYGVTFDSVATSELSGSFDPFSPVNGRMKDNFANFADRAYLQFKTLVSNGRGIKLDDVETVAQGRVWTGEQAKQLGLVDELGGLDRAIAYCQRNHTDSGHATVVQWPPKQSLFEFLVAKRRRGGNTTNEDEDTSFEDVEVPSVLQFLFASATDVPGLGSLVFPSDAAVAAATVTAVIGGQVPRFPSAASGVMLTADENSAIRCLLQDNDVPDILANFPPDFWV